MAVEYKASSSYSNTSVNRKYLDLFQPVIEQDELDQDQTTMVIQPKHHKRPDLLAYDLYGNSRLWWIFVHYNRDTIKDPIMDFKSGTKIQVPRTYKSSGNN